VEMEVEVEKVGVYSWMEMVVSELLEENKVACRKEEYCWYIDVFISHDA
jgi:hypothetical protein